MFSKPKFLLIDDSVADCRYIELLLEIEEVDVDLVQKDTAIAALDYLKACSVSQFPDIILVDINMPLMNGFEFVEHFEGVYAVRFPETRIFIMSSTCRLSEIEKARQLSAVEDFFEKPLLVDYLQQNILKRENQIS